jgi:hypothetical protein
MTTQQLIPFGGSTAVAIPNYFADIFGAESNIPAKASVPQLSVKGGKFRIILDGEETVMMRNNPDTNEPEPVALVKLVVLNTGKRAARSYYPGKYNPENVTGPACFSLDGEKPDASVAQPQSTTCASCPMSQKGSKISEASGKAITACTMQRRLAVVPASKLDFEPLLMRLAPTSAWDKNNAENESQGWYAWQQYLDFIASRGAKHTAAIVTMVKFDSATEYPKLLFKPDRFLTQEEAMQIKDVWNGEKVQALLEAKEHEAVGGAVQEPFEQAAPPAQAPIAPPVAPKPAKPAKPAATQTAPVTPAAVEPAPAAASPSEPIGSKLASLMDEWDA